MPTVNQAVDEIQYRLGEDPTGTPVRYTDTIVLSVLNTYLPEIAGLAHPSLLEDLQDNKDITVQATGYALSNLSTTYFRYINSRLRLLSTGGWITKVEPEAWGVFDNQYADGSDSDPLCYIWKSTYFLKVTTYSGNYNKVKLFYIKKPDDMTAGESIPLHPILHPELMALAESQLRKTYKHGTPEDINLIYNRILAINEKYKQGELI